MTDEAKQAAGQKDDAPSAKKAGKGCVEKPDWATGLKQFYDSVVDEPLPDELTQLLAQLDSGDDA